MGAESATDRSDGTGGEPSAPAPFTKDTGQVAGLPDYKYLETLRVRGSERLRALLRRRDPDGISKNPTDINLRKALGESDDFDTKDAWMKPAPPVRFEQHKDDPNKWRLYYPGPEGEEYVGEIRLRDPKLHWENSWGAFPAHSDEYRSFRGMEAAAYYALKCYLKWKAGLVGDWEEMRRLNRFGESNEDDFKDVWDNPIQLIQWSDSQSLWHVYYLENGREELIGNISNGKHSPTGVAEIDEIRKRYPWVAIPMHGIQSVALFADQQEACAYLVKLSKTPGVAHDDDEGVLQANKLTNAQLRRYSLRETELDDTDWKDIIDGPPAWTFEEFFATFEVYENEGYARNSFWRHFFKRLNGTFNGAVACAWALCFRREKGGKRVILLVPTRAYQPTNDEIKGYFFSKKDGDHELVVSEDDFRAQAGDI